MQTGLMAPSSKNAACSPPQDCMTLLNVFEGAVTAVNQQSGDVQRARRVPFGGR